MIKMLQLAGHFFSFKNAGRERVNDVSKSAIYCFMRVQFSLF